MKHFTKWLPRSSNLVKFLLLHSSIIIEILVRDSPEYKGSLVPMVNAIRRAEMQFCYHGRARTSIYHKYDLHDHVTLLKSESKGNANFISFTQTTTTDPTRHRRIRRQTRSTRTLKRPTRLQSTLSYTHCKIYFIGLSHVFCYHARVDPTKAI